MLPLTKNVQRQFLDAQKMSLPEMLIYDDFSDIFDHIF